MRKYAVPCVISLLVAALYNIVDQIFIANADYLGSYGNAANTVVFPFTVVALAIAMLIGDGCCAYVSISLGRRQLRNAVESEGSAVMLSVVSGVLLAAVYLLFQNPLLNALGGSVNEITFGYAKEYFFWIAVGIPFYMFGQAMNPVIRTDGSPRYAMMSTLAGACLNIILDPLFIFVFRWGMAGAAIATVLGQILTAVLAALYLRHMKAVHLQNKDVGFHLHIVPDYLKLGMCSFISQISLAVSMAAVQNVTVQYGALDPIFSQPQYAQIPMAVLGIVMKFFQIVISISIGMAAGCIPIVGYNIGAERKDRAAKILTYLLIAETIVGAVALLIAEVFPASLIQIFGAAQESAYYTDFAVRCFHIYLCTVVLAVINKSLFIYIQSLGQAYLSTMLSVIREIVFGVGLALILPHYLGLDGLLFSMPAADILTFIISCAVIMQTYKRLHTDSYAADELQH